jgi:4-aminobutyrate aminotransferase / (S)-3-amino-2-methylpropionate transaminase / 5-aminovalerate transaminase
VTLPLEPNFGKMLGRMTTAAPGPRSLELAADLLQLEMPTSNTVSAGDMPIVWDAALGANILDVDGNIYVDLTAASCVAAAGHSNPEIVKAISTQASRLMHTQGVTNPCVPRIELLKKLAHVAPGNLSMSHISNTGAEAVETAYKTARLYARQPGFLAFEGGFHGKLGGALTLTSKNYYRQDFLPLMPEVYHYPYAYCYRCPYGREYPACDIFCARYIEERLDNPDSGLPRMAGLIFEPVIGHGGWIVPPREFVQELRRITRERDILLLADEIITGFGRTGKWFACQHADVTPDILIVAKSMASGYPVSAMITTPEIGQAWQSSQHTSTFLGNPLGSVAALASINYIETHNLVERSAQIGARMLDALRQMQIRYPIMGDVRGLGSMVGFEIVTDPKSKTPSRALARQIRELCHTRGVLASNVGGMYGNVFKLSPPLVITDEQIDYALAVLDESIANVQKAAQ